MSTLTDLVAIGKLAAANPAIAQIVATPSISLPGPGLLTNTNDLLGTDGITGLKTGNLGEGSYALLYTAHLDVGAAEPLRVTGVVLGGYSRESVNLSVLASLDSIRNGFHDVPVATRGQQVGTYSTPWGSTAELVVGESASIFTWSDTPITATMEITSPTTYEDGEVVGSITWTAGPQTATARVALEGSISPPTEWWRLTHPSELGAGSSKGQPIPVVYAWAPPSCTPKLMLGESRTCSGSPSARTTTSGDPPPAGGASIMVTALRGP